MKRKPELPASYVITYDPKKGLTAEIQLGNRVGGPNSINNAHNALNETLYLSEILNLFPNTEIESKSMGTVWADVNESHVDISPSELRIRDIESGIPFYVTCTNQEAPKQDTRRCGNKILSDTKNIDESHASTIILIGDTTPDEVYKELAAIGASPYVTRGISTVFKKEGTNYVIPQTTDKETYQGIAVYYETTPKYFRDTIATIESLLGILDNHNISWSIYEPK